MNRTTENRIADSVSRYCYGPALHNMFELVEWQDSIVQRIRFQLRNLKHNKTPLASQGKSNS